ncbi:DNA damage-repair/toleration protein DRT102-like [Corylus avellana]|uniref:DNA damage-repair/toleration protein DRT102-like n=1 Tax=Corylus avellana TaxID=13451 RepID=UPI001E21F15D|nr:DNA damage-repair/toleration protein DRT102-like [Corylus avellana]
MAEPTSTTRPHKIIAGADSFGFALKDALVSQLRSLDIDVEDLGTSSYGSIAAEVGRRVSSSPADTRGLIAYGSSVGFAIFADKFPGVFAATCLASEEALNGRSINKSNSLALACLSTSPESAVEILNTWLNTPFKSPCPASGSNPWPEYCLVNDMEFSPIDTIPGGSMKILRESPTSAIVRFKAGSEEPAHHHTFGLQQVVLEGKKRVWNITKEESYDLGVGDYLFTRAGDVHRAQYYTDTELFITWDGKWDMIFTQDLEAAKAAIDKELENGSK